MARIVSLGVKPTPNFVKMPNVEASSAIAADSNKAYWVDTAAAPVTLTLPASPSMGDIVRIFDVRNTFPYKFSLLQVDCTKYKELSA